MKNSVTFYANSTTLSGSLEASNTKTLREKISIGFRRTVIMHMSAFIFGLLLSRTVAFSDFMPFGTAFCAGITREYSLSALAGMVLGSINTANGMPSMQYIGAGVVAVSLKWVLKIASDNEPINSLISALCGCFFCGICSCFSYELSAENIVRSLGEMLLAGGMAYFINMSMPLINSGRKAARMSIEEMCAALISISAILISVSSYTIFTFSPARCAACILILFAARYGREVSGAICGIVFGFTLSITESNVGYIVGAYALAGLLCGVFSRAGRMMSVISFMLSIVVMSLGFYKTANITAVMTEAALGCAIFRILPQKIHLYVGEFFAPAPQLARVDGLRRSMVMRMRFAASALGGVSESVEEVSERLAKINMPKIYDVFVKTENEACENCGLRIHCYETLKDKTYDAFMQMTKDMRKKGRLEICDYPAKWTSRCMSPERVADTLYKNFTVYDSRCTAEMRIKQIRSVVSEQMNGLSDMLCDMADNMSECEQYDTAAAKSIEAILRKSGVVVSDVCCKLNSSRRMTVEISAEQNDSANFSKLELLKSANNICSRTFTTPCVINSGSKLLVSMTEQPNYNVDVGVSQYCCSNEKFCGDSYSYFDDGFGRTVLLLSDGMGSGGRAAVDSSMASGLMCRLLKAGFGFDCSLRLLNSAMMFRTSDESLATVDITSIDLFSGETNFYKAGTPETIVLRKNKIGRAKCKSCPAGIVNDVSFDHTTAMLDNKDIVLMTSDGVVDSDDEWIEKMLKANKKCSAQELSEKIAQAASRRRNDSHEDDITVIVGIINKIRG